MELRSNLSNAQPNKNFSLCFLIKDSCLQYKQRPPETHTRSDCLSLIYVTDLLVAIEIAGEAILWTLGEIVVAETWSKERPLLRTVIQPLLVNVGTRHCESTSMKGAFVGEAVCSAGNGLEYHSTTAHTLLLGIRIFSPCSSPALSTVRLHLHLPKICTKNTEQRNVTRSPTWNHPKAELLAAKMGTNESPLPRLGFL